MCNQRIRQLQYKRLKSVFAYMDANTDGPEELKKSFNTLGEKLSAEEEAETAVKLFGCRILRSLLS
ncbi:unnamed protein product [Brassica rapa]|uniref:Uncharacterized protein n=2 Tax=Brassica TaxID=3705 RepID=A0A3P6BG58_BRACM|nr:unnamed protein product [Brassica napus]CAG7900622.1 unnamed protein product [Brassica rapa]CDY65152.1 BnaA07g36180D [Brassica napus]VDC95461.1 unnamed protein product [Brassica rapa]